MNLLKSFIVWLCFIPVAILNGGLREHILLHTLGERWALPASGIILSACIFLITWWLLPRVARSSTWRDGWRTGTVWALATIAFELAGGLASGSTLAELLAAYNPLTGNNANLQSDADTLLLIDSGGQYEGGTTDITRTILIGRATDAMKSDFTAVLRGHIALATTVFPKGVFGSQLDTLVRAPLWEIGADFGHGTGHGVGFFLSVHEGPVSISPRAPVKESSRVVPGLVLSNEPGLYRAGQYGIRTENLVTPVVDETMLSAMQPMLRMQTLSLAPIETRLIKTAMMTPVEINWVNDYHNRVREELMPLLSPRARKWLERATEII